MPEATPVSINVTFEVGTGSNGFSFIPNPPIVDLPGNATGTNNFAIIFTLGGPDGATWDINRTGGPILWTGGQPPPLQTGFTLPSLDANQIAVGVNNTNTNPASDPIDFGFHLFVIAQGTSHESPDPEIVLDPP